MNVFIFQSDFFIPQNHIESGGRVKVLPNFCQLSFEKSFLIFQFLKILILLAALDCCKVHISKKQRHRWVTSESEGALKYLSISAWHSQHCWALSASAQPRLKWRLLVGARRPQVCACAMHTHPDTQSKRAFGNARRVIIVNYSVKWRGLLRGETEQVGDFRLMRAEHAGLHISSAGSRKSLKKHAKSAYTRLPRSYYSPPSHLHIRGSFQLCLRGRRWRVGAEGWAGSARWLMERREERAEWE